ncbi:hypothetical protein MHBO_000673 [Bonamia ostreae]|uniref:Protein kinase domain-containing protein n=1 Tax=Bonamia ostreae TaxID=126728 RepID=A0ABV2AGH5_9EUKA
MQKFGGSFEEHLVAKYIFKVLNGLNYLHKEGVIHRDIKAANILSTKDGNMKLADFGVATKLGKESKSNHLVGSPYWMAPEAVEISENMTSACDIWSLGCTTIELLTGKPPYFELSQMQAIFRIVEDECPPLPKKMSQDLEDFLKCCFHKIPKKRATALQLLQHHWIVKNNKDENKGMTKTVFSKISWGNYVEKSKSSFSNNLETNKLLEKYEDTENDEILDIETSFNTKSQEAQIVSKEKSLTEKDNCFEDIPFESINKELKLEKELNLRDAKISFGKLSINLDETEFCDVMEEINDYFKEKNIIKQIVNEELIEENAIKMIRCAINNIYSYSSNIAFLGFVEQVAEISRKTFFRLCLLGLPQFICSVTSKTGNFKVKKSTLDIIETYFIPTETANGNLRDMFISNGGIEIFSNYFNGDFSLYEVLMARATNCVFEVIEESKKLKIAHCQILSENGFYHKLAFYLSKLANSRTPDIIYKISILFRHASQCDNAVRKILCEEIVLKCFILFLKRPEERIMLCGLSCLKNLTKCPILFTNIKESGLMANLITMLSHPNEEVQKEVFKVVYDIIKIQSWLQEAAASMFIVPALIRFVESDGPLKEMAFSLICKMAFAGPMLF